MSVRMRRAILRNFLLTASLISAACVVGCGKGASGTSRGSIEVTAKLVEIPDGAIFQRDLYNYATVLKYEVLEVHRGSVNGKKIIYVGQNNPAKPRSEASDQRAPNIGGNLKSFAAGQVQRLSLDGEMLDVFTGAILNKYSEEDCDPIYWAVWTDLVSG